MKKQPLPTAIELKTIFDKINADIAKDEKRDKVPADESQVVPLTDEEYYAEQIQNLFDCTEEEADVLAFDLARA